jgi:outer membrane receptor protein involved in Fe transport
MTFLPTTGRTAIATAAALALSALSMGAALAQSAAEPAADATAQADGLKLDQVVVTGTSTRTSKMKSSVSISTLDAEQLTKTNATSAAELLRSIPGVRSESSGGEGNANLTVRGVPLSAGGSRYVQFQEDGLPVLMFGDIAFGTADQFVRVDYSTDRLEVVRGGSASTLTSNAPGGIVNFISKTGAEKGGAMGLSVSPDPRQIRLDADYGGSLGAATRFHIGGFQRVGEGGRPTGFNAENGGQFRGNVTQQLDNGYVRVSFKHLDDRTPTFLPVPVRTVNGQIQEIPGIDPRTAFFITNNFQRDSTLNRDGSFTTSSTRDGLRIKSTSFGVEASLKLADGWTLDEKFRKSSNSGRFIGLFPSNNGNTTPAGTFSGVLFNTSLDDFDNLFNEIKLSKSLDFGGSKATFTAGLFNGFQNVAETWYWNTYNITSVGEGSRTVDATGAPSSAPVGTGTTTFGGCCVRNWDVQYSQLAPFAAVNWELGPVTVDASLRRDIQKASGYTIEDNPATGTWDPATQRNVSYRVQHTSYSVGANYALNRNVSTFARVSNGVAFSADRLLFGNPLDGSVPISLNEVDQVEGGVKWRAGGLSTFVTLFNARTTESNYEVTTQTFTNNKYKANGVEFEAAYGIGDFRIVGGITWTDAKITAANAASQVGKKPRRQADVVYQVSPSYAIGNLEFGTAVIGTGKSYGDDDNTITLPAFAVVNAFANYQFGEQVTVSLGVNNLFDKIGYTEVEGSGHAARSINGRTAKIGLKYQF